jgi:hypothetical protein
MDLIFNIISYIPYIFGAFLVAGFLYYFVERLIDYIKNFEGNILKRVLLYLVIYLSLMLLTPFVNEYLVFLSQFNFLVTLILYLLTIFTVVFVLIWIFFRGFKVKD